MIPKDTIRAVSNAADIVGYIGTHVTLKKNGKNYLGLCPFHQEKSPSFFVTPQKNMYKCFGCGASGNVISFVMNHENLPFVDAVKKIAAYAGITIVEENRERSDEKSTERRFFDDAMDFFCEHLKKCSADSPVGQLVQRRKFSAYIIDKYGIGYAPDEWNKLQNFLLAKKYPLELLLKYSLVKKSESGRVYDFYRNRLIFPIRNISGAVIGFGARAIGDDMPKYINPPETPLYGKSNVLYGLHEATPSIRKNRRMIITEGYIDVIRMAQQGFDDTVALCGTALTEGHIRIFKNMRNPKILAMPDGDTAGRNSALKSAKMMLTHNIPGYVCLLESGTDPGDFFDSRSPEDMNHIIERAIESPYFIISESKTDTGRGDSNTRVRALEELAAFSATIPGEHQDYFMDLTTEIFGVNRMMLDTLRNKKQPHPQTPESTPEQSNTNRTDFFKLKELYPRDFNIIECLITGHVNIERLTDIYPPGMFQDTYLKKFYARISRLEQAELRPLSGEDLGECFPEFKNLIDFMVIFSDRRLKDEPAELVNAVLRELMQKNLFDRYSIQSKQSEYEEKKTAYLSYKNKIEQLFALVPSRHTVTTPEIVSLAQR